MKLEQGHGCDERSNHYGDGDSVPAWRKIVFDIQQFWLFTRGFLLNKSDGPGLLFFSRNICDWLLYSIMRICFVDQM